MMFRYLYDFVTINESKQKSRILFYYFSEIKSIVATSSSSNFTVKLICWGIFKFACLDKSIPTIL